MSEVLIEPSSLAPLGKALKSSIGNYEWAKAVIVGNTTIGTHAQVLLNFGENTTKKVLDASPFKIESLIDAVDTRVEKAVAYGSQKAASVRAAPGKLKNETLAMVHGKLNEIKAKKEEVEKEASKLEIATKLEMSTIADDVKTITTEQLNKLLDASEGYLAQFLPMSKEDLEEMKVDLSKGELKPIAIRSFRQGKVAAKRVQESVFSKINGLQARTKQAVHVDLIKYSEYLDEQKSKLSSVVYVAWENANENASNTIKSAAAQASDTIKVKLVAPARERLVSVRLPFHDRLVRIWTVVGDEYEQKVVRPRDQIVQMFREELALQQELAKQQAGSDNELTIAAGMQAVMAAARARLAKEMEVRVFPAINQVLGRSPGVFESGEEETEDKSVYFNEEESE